MKTVVSTSLEDTQMLARNWLASLSPSTDGACVVGLYGTLGAGKTAFTQALARELGVKGPITSPTFVIEKLYETTNSTWKRLVHIDAYRLTAGRELQDLDFETLVENPHNFVIIEWPENVKEILPPDHIKIQCEFVDETSRRYIF